MTQKEKQPSAICANYLQNYFDVIFFNTERISDDYFLKLSYALRHNVFCQELGYEEENNFELEFDEYDAQSRGCLIFTKNEINPIASVRLIFPNKRKELPCLSILKHYDSQQYLDVKNEFNGLMYVEISRLLILKKFRSHKLLLILIATIFAMSKDLDYAVFMCEKKLIMFLRRLEIPFEILLPQGFKHRGLRFPIKLNIQECQNTLNQPNTTPFKNLTSLVNYLTKEANTIINPITKGDN